MGTILCAHCNIEVFMFLVLVFLFTLIPAVEIFLLFQVGSQIGGLNTFFVVLATGILGATLARSQGLSILKRMQKDMGSGSLPGDQIIQGLMVFAGGLLLLTPGFMTDIFGFLLVLPGSRHFLMIVVKHFMENSIKNSMNNSKINIKTFSSAGGFSYNSQPFEQKREESFRDSTLVDTDVFDAEFTKKDS